MTRNERALRAITGVLAVLIILVLGHPFHAEPQGGDPVAQGRQALEAGRVDEAIALLERAVAADPKNPAALAWLGNARVRKASGAPLMERAGWVNRGFDTLDEAVERFPDAWIVYLVRGLTAVNLPPMFNKTKIAIDDLGRVVAMKDRAPQAVPDAVMGPAFLNLGLAYKHGGDREQARVVWEKGRRLYPAAPEASAIERELKAL
jgi:tetratricopeptide (TPR) repeat protein